MKENLTDIMNDLKIGQIIRLNNKEYVFIEPKRTRAVVYDKTTQKEYLIKGMVEVTEERDEETINRVEEEAIQEFLMERKIRKMVKGQCFIGVDDKEYSYVKFNKTTLVCINRETKEKYRCKVRFVKTILDKVITEEKE